MCGCQIAMLVLRIWLLQMEKRVLQRWRLMAHLRLSITATLILFKQPIVRVITDIRTRDMLGELIPPGAPKLVEREQKKVLELKDLLEKCLALDPAKRIQPKDAINHPFLQPN